MASKKEISQWEQYFKAIDKDGSGSIDEGEFRELLAREGSRLTESEIENFFKFFDGPEGDKKITLDEFARGMNSVCDTVKELTALFLQADVDNSGFLDKEELRDLMQKSKHPFPSSEVNEILALADKNGDGKITLTELIQAFS